MKESHNASWRAGYNAGVQAERERLLITDELITQILRAAEEECRTFARRDIRKVLNNWLGGEQPQPAPEKE